MRQRRFSGNDVAIGLSVVEGDQAVDDLTAEVELLIWPLLDVEGMPTVTLRHLVGVLLILPELERSGDLAEHIAQRAVTNIGAEMSPLSRGIVQRMSEVALEMWRDAADAYVDRISRAEALAEDDEEIDILHDRLTREIAAGTMPSADRGPSDTRRPLLRTTRRSRGQSRPPNRTPARSGVARRGGGAPSSPCCIDRSHGPTSHTHDEDCIFCARSGTGSNARSCRRQPRQRQGGFVSIRSIGARVARRQLHSMRTSGDAQ